MRWSPDGAHMTATRESASYMRLPLPSPFIWIAFLVLFLLDSVEALEAKTSSLFLSFSYSAALYVITIPKVVVIVPLKRSFMSIFQPYAMLTYGVLGKDIRYNHRRPQVVQYQMQKACLWIQTNFMLILVSSLLTISLG